MPFFSFILKKKYTTSQLGILDANLKILIAGKKYFSKNTNVWKLLNKKIIIFKFKKYNMNQMI